MRSFFGVKKVAVLQPSTSSVHWENNNSRTETANTILSLWAGTYVGIVLIMELILKKEQHLGIANRRV
jgi:hypothetical protein